LRRRRRVLGATAIAALVAAVGLALHVAERWRAGRDVHGSASTEYVATTTPEPPPRPQLAWPQWGRMPARTRSSPAGPRPPFRLRWVFRGGSLLEFPPALAYGRIYLPTFAGLLFALDPASGRTLWRYDSRRCAWASPAVASGLVFQTFLLRPPACRPEVDAHGLLVALDARTGAERWRVALPPTESSPLVAGGLVWIGDWSGDVTGFDAATGRRRWTFHADGAVKSSPSLADGRLFVGTYAGRLYALDPSSGAELWRASVQPRLFGRGRFYSTPAVAHGRVFLGATDGKVYAYGARSGKLRWSFSTSGYVYGSPAIWRDLVLVGSYSRRFYALDAATGVVRWSFDARGPISGSASVVAGVVYVSTLAERTFALDARTGRELWSFPDGKYCAGVADATRFYLVGYDRLFALTPRR
jgi:outer membrane protein assembly factor BamB